MRYARKSRQMRKILVKWAGVLSSESMGSEEVKRMGAGAGQFPYGRPAGRPYRRSYAAVLNLGNSKLLLPQNTYPQNTATPFRKPTQIAGEGLCKIRYDQAIPVLF